MTQENTVVADANSETAASGEVDAQLDQMRQAEAGESRQVPEQVAEEQAAPEVKTKEERVVPLAALHEERNQRKQLQQELHQQRQMMERVNQRLETLMKPQQAVPDRGQQPVEYLDHRIDQLAQPLQQMLERDTQRQQQEQQRQAMHQTASQVIQAATDFAKETPEFPQAVQHLHAVRMRELQALGVPPQQAGQQAQAELDQAAIHWQAQGQNPAQIAYEFALARGFQKPAAAAQTPEQRIAAQQKGTAAARTLGTGGAVSGGKLTAEGLANMSDEDFAKLSDSDWRRAMGG